MAVTETPSPARPLGYQSLRHELSAGNVGKFSPERLQKLGPRGEWALLLDTWEAGAGVRSDNTHGEPCGLKNGVSA